MRLNHSAPSYAHYPLQWPDSIAANLLIAGTMGFLYTLLVLGLPRLDPTNLSWLGGDPATFYIGWELFRQDPHFHWPLTYTDRLGYPIGDSIAFMDPIPLLSMVLKPFSSLLPTAFQYLGIAAALAASLQFFFAARLFQMLLGRQIFIVLLPSLFFLIAPPMTWRFVGHYALANHWLLIAALYLFVSLQKTGDDKMLQRAVVCSLLGGTAVAINAYLAFMVLVVLSAGVITAYWQHRFGLKTASLIFAVTGVACLISAFALGFVRGDGGYTGGGYRLYSMNLLAPIDPGTFGALFLRSLPHFSPEQYEGYNYLGAGVLMLGVMLLPSFARLRLWRFRAAEVVPLALACLALTALALSTKVSAGSVLIVDVDPYESLTKYLAVFRSSGRLFWVPYYVILTAILTTAIAHWRPKKAVILITLALIMQFADTVPLRRVIREQVSRSHPAPLRSPQWSSLRKDHRNILVLPPWQCAAMRGANTPGGLDDGFRIFGLLAVSQHMRTNSYYAARYSSASLDFHCDQAVKDLMREPLSSDSAYVVSPSLASIIAAGPTGPNACHTLDGFILCSAKTDFGLGPGSPPEVPMMFASGRIESWREAEARGYFIGDWHAAEPEGIWSKGYGILQFRLSPEQHSRYHAISLRLMVPIGTKGVKYHIQLGSQEQSSTFLGSSAPRVEAFEVRMPFQYSSDGIERITLITQDAVRPIDIGLNQDTRILGLGIIGMTLIP
jgi:hypothetical protein